MSLDDRVRSAGYEALAQPRHGGGGDVYRARDLGSGAIVAFKIGRADAWARMQRELEVGQRVRHPNLAVAIDGGTLDDGSPYLVTSWVSGPTASEVISSDEVIGWGELMAVVDGLVDGLGALHDDGILHRDITPSNIIIGSEGPVLIDLGLGSADAAVTVTAPGDLAGTPRYLAPEVIRGELASEASDQYALALVLYELVARRSPFPESANAATALHHQLHTMPTPLDEVDPSVRQSFAAAIAVALEKDPADRWPSVSGFGEALRRERLPAARSPRRASPRRVAGAVAVLSCAAIAGLLIADDSIDPVGSADITPHRTIPAEIPAEIPNPWNAGAASGLACNLLGAVDFDNGQLGYNYFDNTVDSEADGRERTLPSGGVDGSGVLVVGEPGAYGRYAETVAVLPGQRYELSAAVLPVTPLDTAALRVSWLDENFSLLGGASPERSVSDVEPGRYAVVSDPAPPDARYAAPEVFKDSSDGVVLVDELVFSEAGIDCAP